jgi:hypothetical protein
MFLPLDAPKFVHEVLGNTLSAFLACVRVGQDGFVDKLAHSLLEAPVALLVIRAGEARREPGRFCIGYLGKGVRGERLDLWLFSLDSANLQARILWAV